MTTEIAHTTRTEVSALPAFRRDNKRRAPRRGVNLRDERADFP